MTPFKPLRILVVVIALLAFASGTALLARSAWSALSGPTLSTTSMEIDEFGTVKVVRSDRPARGLVILVADKNDAEASTQDATALAKEGLIAVSFDFEALRAYLANSPASDECHYVSDDMKD